MLMHRRRTSWRVMSSWKSLVDWYPSLSLGERTICCRNTVSHRCSVLNLTDVQYRSSTNMSFSVARPNSNATSTTHSSHPKTSNVYYVVRTLNLWRRSDYFENWSITLIYFNYQKIYLGVRMSCRMITRVKDGIGLWIVLILGNLSFSRGKLSLASPCRL